MEIKLKDIDHDMITLSDENIDNDNFVEVFIRCSADKEDDGMTSDGMTSDPVLIDIESLYAAVSAFIIKRQERLERESEIEFQEACNI